MSADPKAFGRVAVLFGGWSAEREVSLQSGSLVLQALKRRGVQADGIDATPEAVLDLRAQGYDRAFIVLHGTGGEDGTVQAALDLQGLPYTGSGVAASALAMDKLRSKRLWQGMGLPTPDYRVPRTVEEAQACLEPLGLPVFVKPNAEGSSVGMTKVTATADMPAAFARAARHGAEVLVERFVAGGEYTAAVLGDEVLPLIRIQPAGDYYDYHAKYIAEDTAYHCPCGLQPGAEREIAALALDAFSAIGAQGWGRVDLMIDAQGQPWLIELNLVPGMTTHSLVPMAAAARGIDFDTLCLNILETSL